MNTRHDAIEQQRKTLSVPIVSGDYGDFIEIGSVGSGVRAQSFMGCTVLVEGQASKLPSGVTVELWLPHVVDGTRARSAYDDTDFHFAGQVVAPSGSSLTAATGTVLSFGAATWEFAGWPGARLRARSGGFDGSITISVVAF